MAVSVKKKERNSELNETSIFSFMKKSRDKKFRLLVQNIYLYHDNFGGGGGGESIRFIGENVLKS